MPTHPVHTVVFDLGGVLIDWNPRYLYRKLLDDERAIDDFLTRVCSPQWNARQDAGRPFAEAVAERSRQFPQFAGLIRAYHERWEEMLGGAIDDTVALLHRLADKGYRLAALTNWSAETFPVAQRRFAFLQRFETILVSGELKLIKPDPRIFQHLLHVLDEPADACVFIDDSPANVDAAATHGLRAIHFQEPAQLCTALTAHGIDLGAAHKRQGCNTPPRTPLPPDRR